MSFFHNHPYAPFLPDNCQKLIVGTIPPPRFSSGELHDDDVDFCYGSRYGLLWPILEQIFDTKLDYENTGQAIEQRKRLLAENRIGICDMVESCIRDRMDASDLGMKEIRLRNLKYVLERNPKVQLLLFMGGNSRNGPEYLFRKHAKTENLDLVLTEPNSPRVNEFHMDNRLIRCISLISPSSAANRSIGGHPHYKAMKALNPSYSTLDFRISQFRTYFEKV